MASGTINDPNAMLYKKGDTYSRTISAFGYITNSGKDALLLFVPPKLLTNVSGFNITSLLTAMRGVGQSYLGGSSSYNPVNDSTVTIAKSISQGVCRIVLSKTSSFGLTNNTPLFGTVTINMTFT